MPRWTRSTSSLIYTPDPVVREHPLNTGLLAWWLPLPHLTGLPRVYSLTGRYTGTRSGTLTWPTTSRPGGFGTAPTFGVSGSFLNVSHGGELSFPTLAPFSYSLWIYPISLGAADFLGCNFANSRLTFNGSRIQLIVGGTATNGPTITSAQWYHIAATFDGSATRIYLNGGLNGSGTGATQANSTSGFLVGFNTQSWSADDIRVYNRALSAADVRNIYADSIAGHPETIRRARTASVVLPAVVAATASLSATLGSLTLSGSATSTAPPSTSASLSATLGSLTLVGTATSTAPSATTASLSATLGSLTATATATTTVATTTGTLSATLGSLTLAANATTYEILASNDFTRSYAVRALASVTGTATRTNAAPLQGYGTRVYVALSKSTAKRGH